MTTGLRAVLDHDMHPRTLWRDRDIIGPLLGVLMLGVVLRDLAHRLDPRSHP